MQWPKLAFFALSGLYFGCSTVLADAGFYPVASTPKVNETVRAAASKVLRLWTPIRYAQFGQEKYDAILRGLDKVQASNLRQRVTYEMMRIDVQRCRERRLPNCRITNTVAWGSAFVLEDGSMISVRHNFSKQGMGLQAKFANLAQDWTRDNQNPNEQARVAEDIAAFKRNPMHDLVFILTDSKENIVFNSALQEFRVLRFALLSQFRGYVDLLGGRVLIERADPQIESTDYSGPDWIDGDGVRIQLGAEFSSLKAGTRESCLFGRAAIAGYPGESTTNRSALGGRDAVEGELSVSVGDIFNLAEAGRRATNWPEWNSYLQDVRGRQTLLTGADATQGMSGGPILNMRGEVCGHLKANFPGDEKISVNPATGLLDMFSFGVPLENLTGI